MLKAVTFDFWWTLVRETPEGSGYSRAERIRRIGAILIEEQIAVDLDAIGRAYETEGQQLEALWTTLRDIDARAQVELLLDNLKIGDRIRRSDPLMQRLIEAYTLPILAFLPKPIEKAADVLAALKARGLKLAVICNTGRTPGSVLRTILERLDLGKYFSAQIFSDEIGLRKPHPDIFNRALSALGVGPEEALHVGDTPSSDISGALALGMRAVYLRHERGTDSFINGAETIQSLSDLLPLIDNKSTGTLAE
ncbi:MAG TPA: HAD family hydrolase [Acidobacteriota bacterium]|nr:HAD family hydrolase [Acidobacteriota bacterium]